MAHTSNLSTWDLEAGGFNLGPAWSTLSQKKKRKKKKAYRNKMWVNYFFSLPKEMKLFSCPKLISSWAESSSHMDLNKGLKAERCRFLFSLVCCAHSLPTSTLLKLSYPFLWSLFHSLTLGHLAHLGEHCLLQLPWRSIWIMDMPWKHKGWKAERSNDTFPYINETLSSAWLFRAPLHIWNLLLIM